MSRRHARMLFVALLMVALGCFAAGGRIYLKAWLAQRLLQRAWVATRAGAGPVKPWPCADTWPVARLTVPRHGVDLIVLADASGRSLAFAPGHVAGSAPPGGASPTVLGGHRDTQFRFLKNLTAGDEIRLETPDGVTHLYGVTEAVIAHARDPGLALEPWTPRLALVTCFPFDAVVPGGPLRYVVVAEPVGGAQAALSSAPPPKSPPLPKSVGWSSTSAPP